MEQEGEGRGGGEGGDENKQLQPQPQPQPQPSPQQQPHQHQKCPRCESLNTKFCYYNNYSLSQPRYFCKACKRYWTQGGTLRNIPVGGGSRKGKRAKSSSSSTHNSSMSQSQLQPQPSPQEVVQNQPNLTTLVRPSPPTVDQSTSPYYQGDGVVVGGGYLSSLAAVHSLNPSSQPFNQSLNVGVIGDVVGSSNSSFLISGFNAASLGSQQHHGSQIRPSLFYQMGNRDRVVESLLPAEQGLVPSSLANSSAAASHPYHWPQSFINNANHRASDSSLWSTINTTSISDGNTQNNIRGGSSSLIPNHWPDLPGYGPPH